MLKRLKAAIAVLMGHGVIANVNVRFIGAVQIDPPKGKPLHQIAVTQHQERATF